MSYSNAEIDFSGVHIACLIGDNGAGKSSLLEAITWTVWEEGRARTDEIVKLGTREMSCELEFFLEEDLYRVYRSRTKGLKSSQGKSNLEFQIYNSKEDSWVSLSRHTVRQTQELITKTLKMDYNTFVNSIYLRQGRADEFTVKRPNERKQILADILDLAKYDELCDAARKKIKLIDSDLLLEKGLIEDLNERIAKEDELKKEKKEISKIYKLEEESYKKTKELLIAKQKELNEKIEKEKQVKTLEDTIQNQESLLSALDEQLEAVSTNIKKNETLIKDKDSTTEKYKKYQDVKSKLEELDKSRVKFAELNEKKAEYEVKLNEKINEAEKQIAVYKSKISDKNTQKQELMARLKNEDKFMKDFLPKAQKEIESFKELQESLSSIEVNGQELKHEKEIMELEVSNLENKAIELTKKMKTLKSHSHDEPCPLCKSPIKDKELVFSSYEKEINQINQNKSLVEKKIADKEKEIKQKREEYAVVKEKISKFGRAVVACLKDLGVTNVPELKRIEKADGAQAVNTLASQIEVTKNEFQRVKEQMLVVENELSACEKEEGSARDLMLSGEYVKEISQELTKIQKEVESLGYDQKEYEFVKSQLKEYEDILVTYNLLIKAESDQEVLIKQSKDLSEKIENGKKQITSTGDILKSISTQLEGIDELKIEVESISEKESAQSDKVQEIRKNLVIIEESLKEISELRKSIKDKKEKIDLMIEDKRQFEVLEKAFSKNGIQVAIIETIVPEIEKEANRILGKLTDYQMNVALRTQKEKKSSKGLQETLDVIIADGLGTRNYELYSGGEAYKINFALRLALSRLLANRVGAKLQALIIDEGFGSQDASGKERLVEIIKSIRDEFELVLVVTHLDELKDSFPSQLYVTKDEEGSKVRLVA